MWIVKERQKGAVDGGKKTEFSQLEVPGKVGNCHYVIIAEKVSCRGKGV